MVLCRAMENSSFKSKTKKVDPSFKVSRPKYHNQHVLGFTQNAGLGVCVS